MHDIDPMRSTDPNYPRSTFLGAAAATAAGTAALGTAFAQIELGKPHPPLVPENDPAIGTARVQQHAPGGDISAYAAWPSTFTPTTPGIVIAMHIWGEDTSIRDLARRLAKAGFSAIAPDLYGRLNAPAGDGGTDFSVFRPFAQKLQREQTAGDLRTGAQWIAARQPAAKVAVLGFCMGGTIALRQAIDNASTFAADAVFYGNPSGIDPAAVNIPVAGSYGERETSIPADEVHAFAHALHVPDDIVEYADAGHAFMDDQRPSYVADAAADAWRRTVTFLTKYLKT